jgi:hypothetical protein
MLEDPDLDPMLLLDKTLEMEIMLEQIEKGEKPTGVLGKRRYLRRTYPSQKDNLPTFPPTMQLKPKVKQHLEDFLIYCLPKGMEIDPSLPLKDSKITHTL